MEIQHITIYVTDVVDGWVAWDGYTWDENSGAIMDRDREMAISRFKAALDSRIGPLDPARVQFDVLED